jgi:N-acetylmuramoyl-L-alanine amidase
MRARSGMILLFAVALPLLRGAAWGETPVTEKPAPSADKPKASACDRRAFRAVIDVGHTQALGGATSARGIYEYEFNLRLAKQVAHKLTAAGFEKTVLLITSEAPYAGLFQRSSRANAMGADLFLSIHHDSVPDPMLEKWTYDGVEHTYNDQFPGHSIFISNDNPQSGRSLEFASLLGAQLKSRGLKYTPHYTERFMGHRRREIVDAANGVYRYDQLIVLRSTHMPAVLLEAGSIINRKEELELAKPERVALVADAALDAVESYCDAHGQRLIIAAQPHAPRVQTVSGHAAKSATALHEGNAARQ